MTRGRRERVSSEANPFSVLVLAFFLRGNVFSISPERTKELNEIVERIHDLMQRFYQAKRERFVADVLVAT
jgi:hypothetical protein